MTIFNLVTPIFNLANPSEADAAVAWVDSITEHTPDVVDNGYNCNSYPSFICSILNNSVDGYTDASALAFVSAACRARHVGYAEFIFDLVLFVEARLEHISSVMCWRDLYTACREGVSFSHSLSDYEGLVGTPEWIAAKERFDTIIQSMEEPDDLSIPQPS